MVTKTCQVCYKRYQARRSDSKTCSPACRQKAYRRRARAAKPRRTMDEITADRVWTKAGRLHGPFTCKHDPCGRPFHTDGMSTARLYCSNACRQAAYRARKAQARIAAEVAFLEKARG